MNPAFLKELVQKKYYGELKQSLQNLTDPMLLSFWKESPLLEKILLFKLLDVERAFCFFQLLSPPERYLILGATETGSLGPAIESLTEAEKKRFFHQLSKEQVDRMVEIANDDSQYPSYRFERPAGQRV